MAENLLNRECYRSDQNVRVGHATCYHTAVGVCFLTTTINRFVTTWDVTSVCNCKMWFNVSGCDITLPCGPIYPPIVWLGLDKEGHPVVVIKLNKRKQKLQRRETRTRNERDWWWRNPTHLNSASTRNDNYLTTGSFIKDVLSKTDFLEPPPFCPTSSVCPLVHGRPDHVVRKRKKRNIFCDPDDHGRDGRGVSSESETQNICSESSEMDVLFRGRSPPPSTFGSPPHQAGRLWWISPNDEDDYDDDDAMPPSDWINDYED